MPDQELMAKHGENNSKEKRAEEKVKVIHGNPQKNVLLLSIIGQEIKSVGDQAILLHKKKFEEAEKNFKLSLAKKVEKYESEKTSLNDEVHSLERQKKSIQELFRQTDSENSRLKQALTAARVQLLELRKREDDLAELKMKLREAENRILRLEEEKKSQEERRQLDELLKETSKLIGPNTKVDPDHQMEEEESSSPPLGESREPSIARRTRARTREGSSSPTNAKKEKRANIQKNNDCGGGDLSEVKDSHRKEEFRGSFNCGLCGFESGTKEKLNLHRSGTGCQNNKGQIHKILNKYKFLENGEMMTMEETTADDLCEKYKHVLTKTSE